MGTFSMYAHNTIRVSKDIPILLVQWECTSVTNGLWLSRPESYVFTPTNQRLPGFKPCARLRSPTNQWLPGFKPCVRLRFPTNQWLHGFKPCTRLQSILFLVPDKYRYFVIYAVLIHSFFHNYFHS